MSWMKRLYDAYQVAEKIDMLPYESRPVPPGHMMMPTHIEIVLDEAGNMLGAQAEQKFVWIPVTEDSSCRSSNIAPHPLCDKLQYVAGDASEYGIPKSCFEDNGDQVGYFSLLSSWNAKYPNRKLNAVIEYVKKKTLIRDLISHNVLYVDANKHFLKSWPQKNNKPKIFDVISSGQSGAVVRWCVNIRGELETRLWMDEAIVNSWVKFAEENITKKMFCMVTSKDECAATTKHPYGIRRIGASDKAKLISSNDNQNFTFRGRFVNADEACSVSYDVSQKAHSALRWLITTRKQAFENNGQVFVSWESDGADLPAMMQNTCESFGEDEYDSYDGNLGQTYAKKIKKKIAGYRARLQLRSNIFVMGLDSADDNKGRLSIVFYRELWGSELLDRVESWHLSYAWFQYYSKDLQFIGAPAPKEIAAAAFGRRIDPKLSKSTVSRILPCIVDGTAIPSDLIRSVCLHAANRIVFKDWWEWEKTLGIACGLYRGSQKERGYKMALEDDRNSRDYLYGRLLAVAERIEQIALSVAGEQRDTNAAKLMQRFSVRPYSTWLQIEQALVPYKTRLRSRRPEFLAKMLCLLDDIHSKFDADDYVKDTPLSGEFLLGYHCQRRELTGKAKIENDKQKEEEENVPC